MKKVNHALMLIILGILTILDIFTRGIPVTWSNLTVINVGMIFAIILNILDIATKGKYRTRRFALIAGVIGLIIGAIYGLASSNL